jgi:hypothetical protein
MQHVSDKAPFLVVVKDQYGARVYESAHRTPAAASRRLASLIQNTRKHLPGVACARFYIEDWKLHDSGTLYNERPLIPFRMCYGL